jgi:2-polyprenyl-3-methyl-5-hydroxy-6-metoxy-1,4-benzoquinol methylase
MYQTLEVVETFEFSYNIMTLQKDPERNEIKHLRKVVDLVNKRVLEIGCGEGRLTWKYARWTDSIVATDLDRDSLRVAKLDRPYDLGGIVHLACADSHDLPFSKEKFEIAILAWSL